MEACVESAVVGNEVKQGKMQQMFVVLKRMFQVKKEDIESLLTEMQQRFAQSVHHILCCEIVQKYCCELNMVKDWAWLNNFYRFFSS